MAAGSCPSSKLSSSSLSVLIGVLLIRKKHKMCWSDIEMNILNVKRQRCQCIITLTCERTAGCWCGGVQWAPVLLWRLPSSGSGRYPAGSAHRCLREDPPRAAACLFPAAFPHFLQYPRRPQGGAVSLAQPLAVTVRTVLAARKVLMDQAAAVCTRWACTGSRSATAWKLGHRLHTYRGVELKNYPSDCTALS